MDILKLLAKLLKLQDPALQRGDGSVRLKNNGEKT